MSTPFERDCSAVSEIPTGLWKFKTAHGKTTNCRDVSLTIGYDLEKFLRKVHNKAIEGIFGAVKRSVFRTKLDARLEKKILQYLLRTYRVDNSCMHTFKSNETGAISNESQ